MGTETTVKLVLGPGKGGSAPGIGLWGPEGSDRNRYLFLILTQKKIKGRAGELFERSFSAS